MKTFQWVATACLAALLLANAGVARAASASEINGGAQAALSALYDRTPSARTLGAKSRAILIFPKIVKAGFMIGAQTGEGVLLKHGQPVAYYRSSGGSYGFQAGVQTYSYAMFLMTPAAVSYLDQNHGWEVGVGPSIVIADQGMGKNVTTTTTRKDVYAFIFGQTGLMAGAGLQGVKIKRIEK
jgi:lipid-binding SYLF domain-containing protein